MAIMSMLLSSRHLGALSFRFNMKNINPKMLRKMSSCTIDTINTKHLNEVPKDNLLGKVVRVEGWVRTVRAQKSVIFIGLNDGSSLSGIQIVADDNQATVFKDAEKLTTGSCVSIVGDLVLSNGKNQDIEMKAKNITVLGTSSEDYPLQKKRHSMEFLRTIAHLRPRTNTFGAIARVRSALSHGTHDFFRKEGFLHLHSPIITSSDCEGAGQQFRVSSITGNDNEHHSTPPLADASALSSPSESRTKEFFGRPAYLTVSAQLSAETYATALGKVYTFGPTFRAENSHTTKHLAEFNMIEPEISFCDLQGALDNAERFVKHVVSYALQTCKEDLQFFNKHNDDKLLTRLQNIVDRPFRRVSYSEAVVLLQGEISKNPSQWRYPDVRFGTDLSTEHERWLSESYCDNSCVFIHNFPKQIKPFYMRDNEDNLTVDSFDLLVPGIGELIGGSQREERFDILHSKMKAQGLDIEAYDWYLDLRRYGTVVHSGYGLGFERLVCLVTATENIRDAIAFPRYPGNADF